MRRLFAALALPLVLAGALEVHDHGLAASHTEHLGPASRFTPEAAHPNQACHVEASGEAEHSDCAACLYSLSARGLHVPLAPTLRVDVSGERLPLAPDRVASDPRARRVGGRSPPLV